MTSGDVARSADFVIIGNEVQRQSQFANYIAASIMASRTEKRQHTAVLEGGVPHSLHQVVGANGLELDEATVGDGNCGLDAILRNLERLQLSHDFARDLVRSIRRLGGQRVLLALRLKALGWIREKQNIEVAPEKRWV